MSLKGKASLQCNLGSGRSLAVPHFCSEIIVYQEETTRVKATKAGALPASWLPALCKPVSFLL